MSSGGGYEQGSTSTGPWPGQQEHLLDIFGSARRLATGYNNKGELVVGQYEPEFGDKSSKNFLNEYLNSPMAYDFYGYKPTKGFVDSQIWNPIVTDDKGKTTGGNWTTQKTYQLTGMEKVPEQVAVAPFTQAQTQAQNAILGRAYNNPLNDEAQSQVMNIMKGGDAIDPQLMSAANIGDVLPMYFADVSGVNIPGVTVGAAPKIGDINYAGEDQLGQTAQGDYLLGGGNPYLDPMFDAATRQLNRNYQRNVIPTLDSSAELAGAYGSDVWKNLRSDANQDYLNAIGDLSAKMYGNAYESERGRMMDAQTFGANIGLDTAKTNVMSDLEIILSQANINRDLGVAGANIGRDINLARSSNIQEANRINSAQDLERAIQQANLTQQANQFNPEMLFKTEAQNLENKMGMAQYAPQLALQDYEDLARAAAVGEEQRAREQALIDQQIKAWEFYNQEPIQRLGNYSNLTSGSYGGTSQSTAKSGK